MKFMGIIPARYASSRFPGKPLADLCGKTLIHRVYERAEGFVDSLYVATDDERIFHEVQSFGGKAFMTSSDLKSGTDRVCQAYQKTGEKCDVIINIQGDEPFIRREQLETLKGCFDDPTVEIATLVVPFAAGDAEKNLFNPNSPKVVINRRSEAMYFSRSVIPYMRGKDTSEWLTGHVFYKHVGLYAYRPQTLFELTSLPQSSLEKAESLEQLRWLENGYRIKVGFTDQETIGIDTPQDLEKAILRMKNG